MNKNIKIATLLALGTAVISGISNFANKLAVTAIKEPVFYTTLKNGLVAILLIGLILTLGKWREIKSLTRSQIIKLIAIGIVGGSIPFALYFIGLSQTSALSASLIHKSLFIWVAILAIPFLKEKLNKWQWLGFAAIFAANFLTGGFAGFKFGLGEILILAATLLWAAENIIAKKALAGISSFTVAAARMTVGSLILIPVAIQRGAHFSTVASLSGAQWLSVSLTVGLLFAYVTTWYAALKLAPASYVAALLTPATLITNILSALFITRSFDPSLVISFLLISAGISLIVVFSKNHLLLEEGPNSSHA